MFAALCLAILADPAVVLQQRDAIDAAYKADAKALMDRAEAAGMEKLAGEIAVTLLPVDADPLARRPKQASKRTIGLPEAQWQIERQFASLRSDHAAALFRLARRIVREGRPALAFDILEQAAHVDPDYEPARKQLGDQRVGDEWMTPFEARMERARMVWHDSFGWIEAGHVEKYEAGQRFYAGRWMTAEEEAAIRSNSSRAWKVETDHFIVHSNHSIERAADLAGRLEDFHRFFRRTYTTLYDTPRLTRALLESGPIPSREKHVIRDFATQGEYVARLQRDMPNVGISTGLYLTTHRTAYFFHREEARRPQDVLYHEVSHQLLYESDARDRPTAADAHFWAIEGFACYLETFEPGGSPLIGDVDHVRVLRARELLLEDGQHEPFAGFAARGMRAFQRGATLDEIKKRYALATGLTHFFLHAKDGRYREAFLQHLREIYDSRIRTATPLTDLTGLPPEEIDRQYRQYIRQIDESSRSPVILRSQASSD